VLPGSLLAQIEFFEQRIATWAADPAAIGLTAPQVAGLAAEVGAARVAYNASLAARISSRDSTVTFHNATSTMAATGRGLIKEIKAFAQSTGDDDVYADASIPPPADPEPLGPPGTPYDMTTTLNNAGHLLLTWKADNASASSGAYFMLQRRLNTEQSFTLLGGVGAKSFTDVTVPLGTNQAIYIITPHRADLVGQPSNQVVVQFGVNIPSPGQESSGEGGLNIAA